MKRVACAWVVVCLMISCPFSLKAAKDKSWIEIRTPYFTVLSDADEKKARRVAHEFEKFHAVIRQLIPHIQSGPSIPTIVLAAKDERSLRSLLPQFWEEKGSVHPSGIFVGGPEKNYVALRLDMDEDFRYHVVYHEYVHLLMRLNYPPLPTWLSEGLAECFAYAVISDKSSEIGHASPMQLATLKEQPLLTISELLAVDQLSPHYREESKASVFYAQSWALTHLLLLGDKTAHAQKLWKFLELIQKNVPEDEAIAQALGDLKELERRFQEYIMQFSYYAFKVNTPSIEDPKTYSARTVPRIETLAVQGDFFVSTQRWTEAKQMLDSVLAEDPDNAEALTSLGMYYHRQNQRDEARKYFVAAANSGSKSCVTHYYAGISAMQSSEHGSAEMSFRRAMELNSEFAPAYSALAHILVLKEETVEAALKPAMRAVELEPGVLSHQLNLANVLMRLKKVDVAIQYAERVEAAAESARDRQDAKQFLSSARAYQRNLKEYEEIRALGKARETGRIPSPQDNDSYEVEPNILIDREEEYRRRVKAEQDYMKTVEAAKTKGIVTLEGIVTDIHCIDGAVMELIISSKGVAHKFHSANYFKIEYMFIGETYLEELRPCADLDNKRVSIQYIATPGEAFAGEIKALDIY